MPECPRSRLRLGIPGIGATDFATIPPLVELAVWDPGSGIPVRRPIGRTALSDRSNAGTPVINGPSYATKYGWDVVAVCTEAEARRLEAFAELQSQNQRLKIDYPLRLIDETSYLPPEESPHSKTLLQTLQETWSASWVYGYGVFPVQLSIPDGFAVPAGVWGGVAYYKVGFAVDEL